MSGRRLLIPAALAAACCALAAGGPPAAHAQLPQTGSTTTTTCRFVAGDGSTVCTQETVVISGGACYGSGERLFSEDHLDSSHTYRGNAVVSGLDGVAVDGGYADVVRAHARLSDDSGVHAYSEGVVVDDPNCG
jgi:hypothetical protein